MPCYYTDSGLTPVYKTGQVDPYVKWTANGYRLPTEAEWEKAARGGASGHRFPVVGCGHDHAQPGELLQFQPPTPTTSARPRVSSDLCDWRPSHVYTSPVGYFAANGYGLYDMAGNVMEWCWDFYSDGYYSVSPATDPRGPASGAYRVLRGGSWGDYASDARCASRSFYYSPSYASEYVGFRCVRNY